MRQATSQSHATLDQTPIFQRLLAKNLQLNEYKDLLVILYDWYYKHEDNAHKQFDALLALDYFKPKHALLKKDIQAIVGRAIPPPKEYTHVRSSFLHSLGILYVTEGSTLGGLVLAPRIAKTLQRSDVSSFYECYGDQKIANFKRTMNFIAHQCTNTGDINAVIDGALYAFADLQANVQHIRSQSVAAQIA